MFTIYRTEIFSMFTSLIVQKTREKKNKFFLIFLHPDWLQGVVYINQQQHENHLPGNALVHFMPPIQLWLVRELWGGPVVPGTKAYRVEQLGFAVWGLRPLSVHVHCIPWMLLGIGIWEVWRPGQSTLCHVNGIFGLTEHNIHISPQNIALWRNHCFTMMADRCM